MLNLAISIARKVSRKKYNFAAILTNKKNKILSIGLNSFTKTHPLQAKYALKVHQRERIYLHSEIDALRKCKETPYYIYVARVDMNGVPCLAKPCPICEMALLETGVKGIYYTE